jgi:drug/metabolite transporter (DMT)-like permease
VGSDRSLIFAHAIIPAMSKSVFSRGSGLGSRRPVLLGGGLALLAAVLFGVSTPLLQRLGVGVGSLTTAALLYAGAAVTGVLLRQPVEREARVRRGDLGPLLAMALSGAVIGPVALAWGVQHTSATAASLMLTLEAVFTAVLAWRWYGEAVDRRVLAAMALLTLGAVALVLDQADAGRAAGWGLLAVLLATAAWGVDNTVSRRLADRDPGQVVMLKGLLGATATAGLSVVMGEPVPQWPTALGLFLVGATGYGLSLRFYLLAQRTFGAARTGSVFTFAPLIGALLAFLMGERGGGVGLELAVVLMVAGLVLHLAEHHEHAHVHDPLDHEHAHTHGDGHHLHHHDPMPVGPHSHRHHHAPMHHLHPHAPDEHHQHAHSH